MNGQRIIHTKNLHKMFSDSSFEEIDKIMESSWQAFHQYRKLPLKERTAFMRKIAEEVEAHREQLVETAGEETNLPQERLNGELTRTIYQLNNYADAAIRGEWLEARIDTATQEKPPHPDIRKLNVPLGPVVVFGSSNFPFAYSTAGGDTACALAAGCPVIVKAHPAHAHTSQLVAKAIIKAQETCNIPNGTFSHVFGASVEVGKYLVMHKLTKAVGFTGSLAGGKQLFDWGNSREVPIPVFAEMGSVNPVFLLPEKLKASAEEIAATYAESITMGVGQFCTNPGLIIAVEGEDLEKFSNILSEKIKKIIPGKMLHPGIAQSYAQKRKNALKQKNVHVLAVADNPAGENEALPTIAQVAGSAFLSNPLLSQEVFGPFSLVISCKDTNEMNKIAQHLEGQLTATVHATENDFENNKQLFEELQDLCGRFILNGVSTGVSVCLAMQHGGPFPATTDARFTSVGADGIKRFARPVAFQNWTNNLLPDELKNENPLGIWRTINNLLTKEPVNN